LPPFCVTWAGDGVRFVPALLYQLIAIRTLVLGAAGGLAMVSLEVPLGWLLGPLLACTIATVTFVKTAAPVWVRVPSLAVLGAMLGCTFSASTLAAAVNWVPSITIMIVAETALSALLVWYFRWISRYDHITAYFAGVCGVITQATVCAADAKADVPRVAVSHGLRIILLLVLVPLAVNVLTGEAPDPASITVSTKAHISGENLLLLIPCCAAGVYFAGLARIPSPQMLGPMIIFAVLSATGVIEGSFPPWLVNFALAGLGVSIATRFAGVSVPSVFGIMATTLPAIMLLCLGLGAAAAAMSWATGFPPAVSLLILAPSGVAEMALVAMSHGIDPATVAAHHAIRIALTLPAVPIMATIFAQPAQLHHLGPADSAP
jgi:uncharacterized protein